MGSLASSLRWLLLVCIALAGCGGGGGGGGAGTSLSLSRSSVTFSALANDAPPAPQTVVATFVGDGLLVGYPPNESVPPWLSIEAFDDASPVTVRLSVTTTSMPAGTYNTTVRFVTGRENGDGVITRDVAVTYTVRRNITLSNNYLGYSITQGEAIPPAQILVDKGDARWDASSSASWITLIERPSGTGGDFEIRFDTSGLSPGFYTTTVNVVATDTTGGQASVSVNLNLNAPTLSVAPNILSFAARAGSDGVPAAQSVTPSTANGFPSPFSVGVAYQGTATGWLSVPSSGTVPTPVSVRPSTTALAPGRYLATLSFSNGGSSDAGNQVSVTYDVTAAQLQAAPASLRFDVDRETVDADLQSTLTFSDDGAPLTWSVFGPPPAWLEVLDTSGDTRTARTMRVRVRKDVIATMENKTYNQPLVIAYGNAATLGSFTSVPVSLNLALPEVVGVMPYTSVAGKLIRSAAADWAAADRCRSWWAGSRPPTSPSIRIGWCTSSRPRWRPEPTRCESTTRWASRRDVAASSWWARRARSGSSSSPPTALPGVRSRTPAATPCSR